MTVLVTIFLLLLALHLAELRSFLGRGERNDDFDFNLERNWPTAYATFLLGFAAYLLFYVGQWPHTKTFRKQWFALGGIFTFLALDEWYEIHESLARWMAPWTRPYDYLAHGWVLPYAILLVVLIACFARFFLSFASRYRALFALSGALYVGGALALEIVAAPRARHYGYVDREYLILCTFEEALEFTGVLLFTYSLLAFIAERRAAVAATRPARASRRPPASAAPE